MNYCVNLHNFGIFPPSEGAFTLYALPCGHVCTALPWRAGTCRQLLIIHVYRVVSLTCPTQVWKRDSPKAQLFILYSVLLFTLHIGSVNHMDPPDAYYYTYEQNQPIYTPVWVVPYVPVEVDAHAGMVCNGIGCC